MDDEADCTVGLLVDVSPPPLRPSQEDATEATSLLDSSKPKNESSATSQETSLLLDFTDEMEMELSRMDVVCNLSHERVKSLDRWAIDDVKPIDDEEFDFDLQLSPTSSQNESVAAEKMDVDEDDDDDEIFFGNVGFTEQCVSKKTDNTEEEVKPDSPMSAKEWVELCREAQTVAVRVKNAYKSEGSASSTGSDPVLAGIEVPIMSPETERIAEAIRAQHLTTPKSNTDAPVTVNSGTITKSKNSDTVTKSKNSDTVTKKKPEVMKALSRIASDRKQLQNKLLGSDKNLVESESKRLKLDTRGTRSDTVSKPDTGANKSKAVASAPPSSSTNKENNSKDRASLGAQKRLFVARPVPSGSSPLEELAKAVPRVQTKDTLQFTARGPANQSALKSPAPRRSLAVNQRGLKSPAAAARRSLAVPAAANSRRSLAAPAPTNSRKSLAAPAADNSMRSLAAPAATNSRRSLAAPSTAAAATGLKRSASFKSKLQAPTSKLQAPVGGAIRRRSLAPPSTVSGIAAPSATSRLQLPGASARSIRSDSNSSTASDSSVTSAPSSATKNSFISKPAIKGTLLKPGILQRKAPAVKSKLVKPGANTSFPTATNSNNNNSRAPGPLKVIAPVKPIKLNTTFEKEVEMGASPTLNRTFETDQVKEDLSIPIVPPTESNVISSTPVKPDKRVRPKRLMEPVSTPKRANSDSDVFDSPSSNLRSRRSMLPTPTRSRIGSAGSARSHTSTGSADSPLVGMLINLNELDESSNPTLVQTSKPKMMHTPLNKTAIEPTKKTSIWSPIRRARPISTEDEHFMCTKKTATNFVS